MALCTDCWNGCADSNVKRISEIAIENASLRFENERLEKEIDFSRASNVHLQSEKRRLNGVLEKWNICPGCGEEILIIEAHDKCVEVRDDDGKT